VSAAQAPVLSARALRKSYPGPGAPRRLFDGLSLEVAAGELVGILGPSGCGKSTLLRLLASLEPPDGGELLFQGRAAPPAGRARILLLPDESQLFPWLTAAGNVCFVLRACGLPCSREDAGRLLERVHLGEAGDSYPHTLSSGMRQRVVLARGLAAAPQVLLMDEPFARLDAQTRALLQDLVRELWRSVGVTILFVTHDILEVVRLAERIIVLGRNGSIRSDQRNPLAEPRDMGNPGLPPLYARLHRLLEAPAAEVGRAPEGGPQGPADSTR